MWSIFFFRVCLLGAFLLAAWRWGDWRNWEKYYPSILFVMLVNLSASYIGYLHPLWVFSPDAVVTTHTVVEMVNSYLALPATTLLFLTNLPVDGKGRQYAYMGLWVLIYAIIEWADQTVGGISYRNGWTYAHSFFFDCGMFYTIRVHYANPLLAWLIAFAATAFVLITFDFFSAEMK